jgi:hypothetical protein
MTFICAVLIWLPTPNGYVEQMDYEFWLFTPRNRAELRIYMEDDTCFQSLATYL